MRYRYGYHSGFTLIELLVVISIIGILSSVVLASVSAARNKAKDAAIKTLALQMRNVYELKNLESGTYEVTSAFNQSGFPKYSCDILNVPIFNCTISNLDGCTSFYSAGSEGEKICKDIFSKGGGFSVYSSDAFIKNYAIYIQYPGNTNLGRCIGSSGNVTDQSQRSQCFVAGIGL